MGYDLFFVNHTKKQVVGSKRTNNGFEDSYQLMFYLSCCKGDTIEIMGEEHAFIEETVYSSKSSTGYKYIRLYEYYADYDGMPDHQKDRLRLQIF